MAKDRRSVLASGGGLFAAVGMSAISLGDSLLPNKTPGTAPDPPVKSGVSLRDAPIELAGNWKAMIPASAEAVVELMRQTCLKDIRLLSDHQPTRLRVDEHASGSPAIWLHDDGTTMAWIIVDIGDRAWSQLAYQFGHELGHVLANSWQARGKPGGTCQWLEESLVESFSLFALGRLAVEWKRNPPFPNDHAYGDALRDYRDATLEKYRALAADQGGLDPWPKWYATHRAAIEAGDGLNVFARAAATRFLSFYEQDPTCLEGLGALNRWLDRTHLPLNDYLSQWEASCDELHASTSLPQMIRKSLKVTS